MINRNIQIPDKILEPHYVICSECKKILRKYISDNEYNKRIKINDKGIKIFNGKGIKRLLVICLNCIRKRSK